MPTKSQRFLTHLAIPIRFLMLTISLFTTIQVLDSKSQNINVSFPQSSPTQSQYDAANASVITACIFLFINHAICFACFFLGCTFFDGTIMFIDIIAYAFSILWSLLYIYLEWHHGRIWLGVIVTIVPALMNVYEVYRIFWLKEKEY